MRSSLVTVLYLVSSIYNILTLPAYTSRDILMWPNGFSVMRLIKSRLVVGHGGDVRARLPAADTHFLPQLWCPVALMIGIRGILINLTFYMFLHLLYQSYRNQEVGA